MKRVLIISYFFPPVSNMGSHRMARFVRHLREFGWEPVVLTGKTPGWPHVDEKLLEHLPKDLEIHRVGAMDLTMLWRKLRPAGKSATPSASQSHGLTTFINRWLMIPDKYFPWISPAARYARDLKVDAVYSTSEPVSDHLVALQLGDVPWIAEFRDLWLGSPYFARQQPTALHRALHARLERKIVKRANVIVGLSEGIRQYFAKQSDARVIYNCFEPEDYPAVTTTGKFSVVYAGTLYSSRSPEPFFRGFMEFVRQQKLTLDQAEFVWVGGSADLDVAGMMEQTGITPYAKVVGFVRHAEALRRMKTASVLLAIQSPEDAIHVPGKLFEYIGAGRPILAMSRPCETADIITKNKLGWVAEPEPAAVAEKLREAFNGADQISAEKFSARETTRQLAALLDEVTGNRSDSPGATSTRSR